jgi:hypothetical protein
MEIVNVQWWCVASAEMSFETDLSNDDRAMVHDLCKKMGLKLKSHGSVNSNYTNHFLRLHVNHFQATIVAFFQVHDFSKLRLLAQPYQSLFFLTPHSF